jgi:hypothetical protein
MYRQQVDAKGSRPWIEQTTGLHPPAIPCLHPAGDVHAAYSEMGQTGAKKGEQTCCSSATCQLGVQVDDPLLGATLL